MLYVVLCLYVMQFCHVHKVFNLTTRRSIESGEVRLSGAFALIEQHNAPYPPIISIGTDKYLIVIPNAKHHTAQAARTNGQRALR